MCKLKEGSDLSKGRGPGKEAGSGGKAVTLLLGSRKQRLVLNTVEAVTDFDYCLKAIGAL